MTSILHALGFLTESGSLVHNLGQLIGFIPLVCCIICPFFKKKWQMLVTEIVGNFACAVNFLMIGQIGSGIIVYLVAVVQSIISMWHVQTNRPVTKFEDILFLILYVGCGFLGYKGLIDLMPIVGAALNSLATFQRDEQKTRIITLANATIWFIYCLIIGSTNMWSELLAAVTCLMAIYKYRQKRA